MTDWTSPDIHYKRIVETDIYNTTDEVKLSFRPTVLERLTLSLYTVELFPSVVNELRVVVTLIRRDLSSTVDILHEGQYKIDSSTSSVSVAASPSFVLPDDPLACGYSIFIQVELLGSGISHPFNWVIYPITHYTTQLKRLPLAGCHQALDLQALYSSVTSKRPSNSSCFVYFSLGPEAVPPTSRASVTPLNLSPRNPVSTMIDMGAMEEWAKSWISSTCSTSDINVASMKSQIIQKIMNRYRG
jgi:hypothetical protein